MIDKFGQNFPNQDFVLNMTKPFSLFPKATGPHYCKNRVLSKVTMGLFQHGQGSYQAVGLTKDLKVGIEIA